MKFLSLMIVLLFSKGTLAQNAEWDLTDLVKNEKQWNQRLQESKKSLQKLSSCQGTLTSSAKKLLECLDLQSNLSKDTARTCSWAYLQRSTNNLVSKNIENAQSCTHVWTLLSEKTSFFNPEIISAGKDKIMGFVKAEPKLEVYSQYLREILDQTPYILSEKEESLVASLRPILSKSREAFNFLLTAEIKWPKVKMSDGVQEINVSNYTKYRQSDDRDDRQKAFKAFYTTLGNYERTFGSTYSQTVMTRNSLAKIRNHENALTASLSRHQLPESIYRKLVSEVNRSLPTLHRYLKLRADLLNIKNPQYFDVYPSVVKSPRSFSIDETRTMTLASVKPLGKDYVQKITEATSKNWMSIYPKKGKSSGAFMSGSAYDVHPYIFLNHQDDYNSASTYTHEWGHALHSILSNQTQPYPKARYSIFVAEIAAITNEILLNHYAIENAKTKEERLYYLNQALESLRSTYFRQTQFAEFELAVHETAQKQGGITGQKISEIYGDIQKRYYGHSKKVMNIDPLYYKEWMFVPHFYGGFYVFQYSTSMAGAYYFADKILAGDKKVLNQYLTALKAGGSKYPHEILLDAGLDLSKSEPYRVLEKRTQNLISQMEQLVKEIKLKPKS